MFVCIHCGSSLRTGEGLRLYRLTERPLVDREAAEGFLRSWFAGDDGPADMGTAAGYEVGGLRHFPFLRIRRVGADRVAPLAPLPSPEVMSLAQVPVQLVADGDLASTGGDIDEDFLRKELRQAAADPDSREVLIEQRAYYPVQYDYKGDRYSAVIDGGAGRVLASRRPPRREVLGERKVAMGLLALLFGEAVLVPGLTARIVVIAVTASASYPLLRWALARYG
jgi:hypothetical protein